MTLLIFFLVLAIGVSFFCSISEAVLLSVRPSYIATLEQQGDKRAKTLQKLRDNLDRPLAAILTANTIAHTVGAAGVGAQAAVLFGNEYLGVISGVLTLLILIFSEIIPKTIGATYWKQLAPTFGRLIDGLTLMLLPFVWLSALLTRMLAPAGVSGFTFSREEMEAMAEIGATEGVLEDKELKIVKNLMALQQLSVRDIMTPRSVVFSVPADMQVQDFFIQYEKNPFSRIPLYGDGIDDVGHYVLKADLLVAQAKDEFARPLSDFKREFMMLPDILSASSCFDKLTQERAHIALVIDEYGSMAGLVTLEDVLETLIGLQITDELDTVEDMQVLAHKRWRERMRNIGVDPDSFDHAKEKQDGESKPT